MSLIAVVAVFVVAVVKLEVYRPTPCPAITSGDTAKPQYTYLNKEVILYKVH